jgi:hypothetical protein
MNKCLICGNENNITEEAGVSGFLTEYVFNGEAPATDFNTCTRCGFSWFGYRMTQDECKLLYTGYRGNKYQEIRQKHEPSYTTEFNEFIGNNPYELSSRQDFMVDILAKKKIIDGENSIVSVLDYGGDKGQNIPSWIPFKYVYEMSDVKTNQHVCSWDKKIPGYFDLVMCTHVLEHVPNPWELMNELRRLGKYVYVEVPYSNKSRFGAKPMMHEHINFFTHKSFSLLTGSCLGNQTFHNNVSVRDIEVNCTRTSLLGTVVE